MPTYNVHVFAVYRIEVGHIEAPTPGAACLGVDPALLHRLPERLSVEPPVVDVEYAEEISHYRGDPAGCSETENPSWLWYDRTTPLPDVHLLVEGGHALVALAESLDLDQAELARRLKEEVRLEIVPDAATQLWVIAHFWPSGGVDLYPALGSAEEPTTEQCIRLIGPNWEAGHRLEPYGPFPVGAQLPYIG